MRIAHVVWGMKTGGVETMLVNIINEQVKTEVVHLFVINDAIEDSIINKISSHCKIHRLNRREGSRNPLKIVKLNLWIWSYRPDIIHVHSYQVSKLIMGKWNIVRTIHNTGNIPEEDPRMKALFAISDIVRDVTIKQGFSNVVTVYNGIDVTAFKQKVTFKRTGDIFHIVQVSRLDIEQKGQHILIKALDILVNKYHVTNFLMHFIGEGKSKDMLQEMVSKAGIEKHVCFEGLKTQAFLHENLCDYDIFVQPSLYEGFGLTVAEALAAKVPVVVSDIEGPMEIIGYGKYGMPFKVGDAADLAERLKYILQGKYDYLLVEKAYQHVCREYDVRKTAQRYIQEYKEVLKQQS